jgi:hypothetical protein
MASTLPETCIRRTGDASEASSWDLPGISAGAQCLCEYRTLRIFEAGLTGSPHPTSNTSVQG